MFEVELVELPSGERERWRPTARLVSLLKHVCVSPSLTARKNYETVDMQESGLKVEVQDTRVGVGGGVL